MQVYGVNGTQNSCKFTGKLSQNTLNKLKDQLPLKEYNELAKFRFGKNKFTVVDLKQVTERIVDDIMSPFRVNTYAYVSNTKMKDKPPVRIFIGNDTMTYNKQFKAKVSDAAVRGEKILYA